MLEQAPWEACIDASDRQLGPPDGETDSRNPICGLHDALHGYGIYKRAERSAAALPMN